MKKKDLKIIIITIIGFFFVSHALPVLLMFFLEYAGRTSAQPVIVTIGPNRLDKASDEQETDSSGDGNNVHSLYEDEQTIEHEMEDGSIVTLNKIFGEKDFTCTVGDNTYRIDAISRDDCKYAKITNLHDEDGVIYGMLTVPKYSISERNMKVITSSFDIKEEVVFGFDTATGESEYIYCSKGGRIVGYNHDTLYIMKGRKIREYTRVNVRFARSGNDLNLGWNRKIAVEWIGKRADVYNSETGEMIGTLRCETDG